MGDSNRDSHGKLLPGHTLNKGRKRKKKADPGLILLLSRVMSLKDREDIIKKAVDMAKEGDKVAREWLFAYLYGKPTDVVDLTVTGGMSLDLWLANAKQRMDQAEEVME